MNYQDLKYDYEHETKHLINCVNEKSFLNSSFEILFHVFLSGKYYFQNKYPFHLVKSKYII